MDAIIGEIETYPEIKRYSLLNLFTEEERIVTHLQLQNAFAESDLMKIKAGRHNAWLLTEIA